MCSEFTSVGVNVEQSADLANVGQRPPTTPTWITRFDPFPSIFPLQGSSDGPPVTCSAFRPQSSCCCRVTGDAQSQHRRFPPRAAGVFVLSRDPPPPRRTLKSRNKSESRDAVQSACGVFPRINCLTFFYQTPKLSHLAKFFFLLFFFFFFRT